MYFFWAKNFFVVKITIKCIQREEYSIKILNINTFSHALFTFLKALGIYFFDGSTITFAGVRKLEIQNKFFVSKVCSPSNSLAFCSRYYFESTRDLVFSRAEFSAVLIQSPDPEAQWSSEAQGDKERHHPACYLQFHV